METRATLRYARISPQKCRLVADQIRGKSVSHALNVLKFSTKKASNIVLKILESAIANAENNDGADIDNLKVSSVMVGDAPSFTRYRARAKGRGNQIIKRKSHITVKVSSKE